MEFSWTKRLCPVIVIIILLDLIITSTASIVFTSQPKDTVIADGSALTLDCTANTTLNGILAFSWKRNNTWIVDYVSKHYLLRPNGSLYFMRFLHADQGTYQCFAVVQDSNNRHLGQIDSKKAKVEIAYIKDKFKLDPDTRSGLLGSTIQLQCISPESYPYAVVYWEKDGSRLTGHTNGSIVISSERIVSSTLSIANLTNLDIGSYRCCAYNKLVQGKLIKSRASTVSVAAAQEFPYFERRPTLLIATRYRSVTWECIMRGVPPPTISWYRNGQLVQNTSNRYMLSTGSLHFVSMEEHYNGSYVCEGTNSLGSKSNPPVPLIIAFIDYDFKTNPTNQTILAGNVLSLDCRPPRSYPTNIQITWYKHYVKIQPSTGVTVSESGTLQITNAKIEDGGMYFCQGVNPSTTEARTSKKAYVTVQILPTIVTTLKNISAIVGELVNVECKAAGHPTPGVQWFKRNQLISSNGILSIQRVNLTHAGNYKCTASNAAGTATKLIHLSVYTKPDLAKGPQNLTTIIGQTVFYECVFVGHPLPFVYWYFKTGSTSRKLLNFGGGRFNQTSGGLLISNIRKSDEGKFICVGNSTGGISEGSAWLRVFVPPTFTGKPTNRTTNQSSIISFFCSAEGDPTPVLSWHRNGQQLHSNTKYTLSVNTLTIKNSQSEDSGFYTCRGTNDAGVNNTRAFLKVLVPPGIVSFVFPNHTKLGDNFTLTCIGTGIPSPFLHWRKNNTELMPDGVRVKQNGTILSITNAMSDDSGYYECLLENVLGQDRRSANIVVRVHPNPPEIQNPIALSSTSVQISWPNPFDGYSQILYFSLEITRKESPNTWKIYDNFIHLNLNHYNISGLQPFTMYRIRMRARNVIGISQYSNVKEIRTLQDAPSIPVNIRTNIINATTISLNWNEPTIKHGIIVLYQIQYGILETATSKVANVSANQMSSFNLILYNLKPFSRYYFRIRAATGSNGGMNWGNMSGVTYINTPEAAPNEAPRNLNVTAISSTEIAVQFLPVAPEVANGFIQGYRIIYRESHPPTSQATERVFNSTRNVIGGLKIYMNYTVYVKSFTRAGDGPPTRKVSVTTLESVPGPVSNPKALASGPSAINISWNPPLEQNGIIIGYLIVFQNNTHMRNNTLRRPAGIENYQIKHLVSNRTYLIWIAALTNVGVGPLSGTLTIHLTPSVVKTTGKPNTTGVVCPLCRNTSTISSTSVTTSVAVSVPGSFDWLNNKQFPVLIGVAVTILVLLVTVIILISFFCGKRIRRGRHIFKEERWVPDTRSNTNSTLRGAENPTYRQDIDVKRPSLTEVSTIGAPSGLEDNVTSQIHLEDDLLWEVESEIQTEDINSSNANAITEPVQGKKKDDKFPLVGLRNNVVDLGDDASDYDSPYSSIGELGEPFSADLFDFVNQENVDLPEDHSQHQRSASASIRKSSESSSEADMSQIPPEIIIDTSPIDETDMDSSIFPISTISDTYTPVVNSQNRPNDTNAVDYPNDNGNVYDVPDIQVSSDDMPLYSQVDKTKKTRKKEKDEEDSIDANYDFDQGTMFVGDDTVLIFDERTKL